MKDDKVVRKGSKLIRKINRLKDELFDMDMSAAEYREVVAMVERWHDELGDDIFLFVTRVYDEGPPPGSKVVSIAEGVMRKGGNAA